MKSYFSPPNNIKFLVPSETLIDPSILLNLIRKDLARIKVLYEMLYTKIFSYDFLSIKIFFKIKIFHFNYVIETKTSCKCQFLLICWGRDMTFNVFLLLHILSGNSKY